MSQMVDFHVAQTYNKSVEVFDAICPDIFDDPKLKPSEFVADVWRNYLKSAVEKSNNLNGSIFEFVVASALLRKGIKPFHRSAELAFVPNVRFDFVLVAKPMQIFTLTLKTSLRERYKQADLEAMALKHVHRRAKSCLVTLDTQEAQSVMAKIEKGAIMALDDVVVATSSDFDRLVKDFSGFNYLDNLSINLLDRSNVIG